MGSGKQRGCLVKILQEEILEDMRDIICGEECDGPMGIDMKYEDLKKA